MNNNSQPQTVLQLVEQENYLDTAADYYGVQYTVFDGKNFVNKYIDSVMEKPEMVDATPEIKSIWKEVKQIRKEFDKNCNKLMNSVDRHCINCDGQMYKVKSTGALWKLSAKGLCLKPLSFNMDKIHVTWCPNCKVSFSEHYQHRSHSVDIIVNFEKVGQVSYYNSSRGSADFNVEITENTPSWVPRRMDEEKFIAERLEQKRNPKFIPPMEDQTKEYAEWADVLTIAMSQHDDETAIAIADQSMGYPLSETQIELLEKAGVEVE